MSGTYCCDRLISSGEVIRDNASLVPAVFISISAVQTDASDSFVTRRLRWFMYENQQVLYSSFVWYEYSTYRTCSIYYLTAIKPKKHSLSKTSIFINVGLREQHKIVLYLLYFSSDEDSTCTIPAQIQKIRYYRAFHEKSVWAYIAAKPLNLTKTWRGKIKSCRTLYK